MMEPYKENHLYNKGHPLCNPDILFEMSEQSNWDHETLTACSCVCKLWEEIIGKEIVPNWNKKICCEIEEKFPDFSKSSFFGKEKWEQYFGKIGPERLLPRDICKILSSECPFSLEKLIGTVADTHLLVLVPQAVNGEPVTINSLRELIKNPLQGNPTCYEYIWDKVIAQHGEKSAKSQWILLTADILKDSRNISYEKQEKMVTDQLGYEVPTALNVITALVAKYASTGECIFGRNPWTYTRCSDKVKYEGGSEFQIIVGGFAASGLCVAGVAMTLPTTPLRPSGCFRSLVFGPLV